MGHSIWGRLGVTFLALLVTAGCTAAAPVSRDVATQSAAAAIPANADPALAAIYRDVIEKEIPGLPFAILDGARKEGKVVWYHPVEPATTKRIVDDFKKKFAFMQVEEFEASGAQLNERFLTEQRAGLKNVDVIEVGSKITIAGYAKDGYIENYKPTSESMYRPGTFEPGVWYPSSMVTQVLYLYNTRLVTEEQAKVLSTWDGLWSPALAGKSIVMASPVTTNSSVLYFYLMDKQFGRDSWTKIRDLKPLIVASSNPAADAVARGEAAITLSSEAIGIRLLTDGAPVRWAVPDPAISVPFPIAVVQSAPHPNAARLLHEFILSKTGQNVYATYGDTSARTDVTDQRAVAKEAWFKKDRQIAKIDFDELERMTPTLIEDWKKLFGQ